jgi:YidC/Oxa1 family membrane protein insertase
MFGTLLVDPIRAAVFALTHLLGGSLGAGVLAASFLLRLALLPLTLKLARKSLAQRRLLNGIRPELTALNARYKKQPDVLWRETLALHQRVGYKQVDPASLLGSLVQLPLLGGMFAALRGLGATHAFAWIANLGRPDAALALIAAGLTGVAGYLGMLPAADSTRAAWFGAGLGMVVSLVFFWKASAVLVLSWGSSAAVSAIQGALLVRENRRRS